jgi:hypothetical protein
MSYQENKNTDISVSEIKQNICVWSCVLGITLMITILDIFGLAIGKTYPNAECYTNQNTMSLSSWLVTVCSAGIIVTGIIFLVSVFALCGLFTHNDIGTVVMRLPCIIFFGCVSAFNCIMNIIGMIELWDQFSLCNSEVPPIGGIAVTIVIVNLIFWLCTCYCTSYGVNGEKIGEYIVV